MTEAAKGFVPASLSVNEGAAPLVEQLITGATELRISVERLENGVTVVDAGIAVRGSVAAGVAIGEICMGGLGRVRLTTSGGAGAAEDGWPPPA